MAGLLDFLFQQPPEGASNFSPLGLLGRAMGQGHPGQPYQPSPETSALQGQLNRTPTSGMLDPNPMTPEPMEPGSFMPRDMALQPSTQGWTGGMHADIPAPNASPAGPAPSQFAAPPPMPPERPAGLGFNRPAPEAPTSPMQLSGARAPDAVGTTTNYPPAPDQGGGGFDKFFDAIGSIYGKGGPGDNLIALGAGLASGGGNWGQGLMRGMAMVNANQMTAKKREEEQRRQAGQMTLAQEIERRTKGQIPAAAALGAIQSGAGSQFLQDAFRKQEQFRPLTDPAERARLGIPETDKGVYQVDSSGKVSAIGTPQTNITMQSESEFNRKAGGTLAGVYGKIVEAGDTAAARTSDLSMLRDLSGRIGNQGSTANVKIAIGPMANALGIKIDGLSDLQAWQSIIQRLAPQMRAPGSGATSDIEFKGFINSLPQASQSPEARSMIIETMDSMAKDSVAKREIAMRVLGGEMTRQQGDAALKALPSPFEAFKNWQQATGQAQQSDVPPVPGARKAPDGNWYVQKDGKTFRVQQ